MVTHQSLVEIIDGALADEVAKYELAIRDGEQYFLTPDWGWGAKLAGVPYRISRGELVAALGDYLTGLGEELKAGSGSVGYVGLKPDSIDAAIGYARDNLEGYVTAHAITSREINERGYSRLDSYSGNTGIVFSALVAAGIGMGINGWNSIPAYLAAVATLVVGATFLALLNSGPIQGGLDQYRRNFVAGFNPNPQQPSLFS